MAEAGRRERLTKRAERHLHCQPTVPHSVRGVCFPVWALPDRMLRFDKLRVLWRHPRHQNPTTTYMYVASHNHDKHTSDLRAVQPRRPQALGNRATDTAVSEPVGQRKSICIHLQVHTAENRLHLGNAGAFFRDDV